MNTIIQSQNKQHNENSQDNILGFYCQTADLFANVGFVVVCDFPIIQNDTKSTKKVNRQGDNISEMDNTLLKIKDMIILQDNRQQDNEYQLLTFDIVRTINVDEYTIVHS